MIVNSVRPVVKQSISSLKNDLTTSIKNEVKGQLPQLSQVALNVATSQDSLFGMPAITPVPSEPRISDLNLVDKNILWTKVTSAGVSLPLPLDSCCSVFRW